MRLPSFAASAMSSRISRKLDLNHPGMSIACGLGLNDCAALAAEEMMRTTPRSTLKAYFLFRESVCLMALLWYQNGTSEGQSPDASSGDLSDQAALPQRLSER